MKRTSSLRKKYIIEGCLFVVLFLSMLLLLSHVFKNGIVEKLNNRRMDRIAEVVSQRLEEMDWEVSKEEIDTLAFENSVYITVTDEEENILATTRNAEAEKGRLGKRTQAAFEEKKEELEQTGESFTSNFDDESNSASFVFIRKIPGHGYVIIRNSALGLNNSVEMMEICYIVAAVLTLLICIPITIYLARKMTEPIYEINDVTKKIAELNFEDTVQVARNDELGMLADSVNLMSDRLKYAMEDLQKDVESRKALVRNMAHELKTPVAVIMGYAENMQYVAQDEPQKLEKYCTVISKECSRMNKVIQRILKLSSYEYGREILQKTDFSVQLLFDNIRRLYMDEFPGRAGEYEEVNRVEGKISGDFEMLQEGLYNFVKNAVSYGKKDGLIRISAWKEEDKIWFSVFNQGDKIPEEEQEKIWDVFYKRNAARTRDGAGFGIGLSIVRQVALVHGGSVEIRNLQDGVEFRLSIKNSFQKI